MRHFGRMLKQTVVLQETHFTVKTVKMRRNFDNGDLMIDSGTYVIPKIDVPCAYQVIKSFVGTANPTTTKEGMVITSQVDQVHIHTHGPLNPPSKCPNSRELPEDRSPRHCSVPKIEKDPLPTKMGSIPLTHDKCRYQI